MTMMKTPPIVDKLAKMTPSKRVEILHRQGMLGYFEYFYSDLVPKGDTFKIQQQRNMMSEELTLELNQKLVDDGSRPVYLKGITFLEDLYPQIGSRFMSDVDIYIQGIDLDKLEKKMVSWGYKSISEQRWQGNAHKKEFLLKNAYGEFCFEFHNKLFWHRDDPSLSFVSKRLPTMANEEAFVFLCGHYAFIHSCQKLYWLWDIYLFLQKYGETLNFERINELAIHFGFKTSIKYCLKLVESAFAFEYKLYKKSYIPVWDQVLFSDHQRSFSYLYLKYFLKDHFRDQWNYQSAYFSKILR